MEKQKMCIKTFNITEGQVGFIKSNSEILHISQSEMLRRILNEVMGLQETETQQLGRERQENLEYETSKT